MNLETFTDQQLLDELLNRRTDRDMSDEDRISCEDCRNFKIWTKRSDPPDSYNPCGLGHSMRFHMPEGWEDPHSGGYFRAICSDRVVVDQQKTEIQPDEPEWPPRGHTKWKPKTVPGGKK